MQAAGNGPAAIQTNIDYEEVFEKIKDFCSKEVQYQQVDHIMIDLDRVYKYDDDICEKIEENTLKYTSLFSTAIDSLLEHEIENAPNDMSSPLHVLLYQRARRNEQIMQEQSGEERPNLDPPFPPTLTRKYTLNFKPRSTQKQVSVRDIKSEEIGRLVSVKGMVTRVSNVKPLVVVTTYSCDVCGNEVFQETKGSQLVDPLKECPSAQCQRNKTKGKLIQQTRGSKFLKFQEVKLQELTEQVPMGHIPRSMTVYFTEAQVRSVLPGQTVVISGIFLPIPYTGYQAMKAGLITDTYIDAHHVLQLKTRYADMELSQETREQIQELVKTPGLYDRLAKSIAPEIYGHEDVKKALMLMLVGGTVVVTPDGMKIRGDLNMCLMGDPGVAKSQLLKHICKIAPRAVYTTGRGSSGVGLTASVNKDPVTEEMVLEAGALVLADNGIACIDEFDKMDETDRTAIHEVMEQQTISISKAGISTTLNARTSILAAANPQYGRYNVKMKATDNINLPAALLSRFDLLFLLLDTPSIDADLRLAHHVSFVHQHLHHPKDEDAEEPLDPVLMKNYISCARAYNPLIPNAVADYLVNAYVHLRSRSDELKDLQYTSPRTLLSITRLATALARLRFATEVQVSDVDEALRLTEVSKSSLDTGDSSSRSQDPVSSLFNLIKQMSTKANGALESEINLSDVRARAVAASFSAEDVDRCIEAYSNQNIWMVTGADGSKLKWIRISDDDDEF